jgi:tetratricopeptide (TPR) repeat protein
MDERRWLPALAVLAALVTASPPAFAQTATQAPAAPPQSQQTVTAPQVPPTPEEVGDALMAHQRYQAAIESYKKAPRDSAVALNKMGIAYQMMFNLEDASRCYQTSLKLDPKSARVLNNLGTIYDALKQYGKAERMYRKALRYEPGSALVLKNLGTNLLAQHKYKKGWEVYKAALAIDPLIFDNSTSPRVENPASLEERGAMNYYMAKGCVRAGLNDRAIEYLRMALNEGFTNPRKIIADSEFAGLRGVPAFEQLLAAQSAP